MGYYDYDSCAFVNAFYFSPQAHAQSHTSINRILVRGSQYIQQSECSFSHLLLFLFLFNFLFFMIYIYFINFFSFVLVTVTR